MKALTQTLTAAEVLLSIEALEYWESEMGSRQDVDVLIRKLKLSLH